MPTQDFGVYPDSLTAGTQVSSTYEGRHVTLLESDLVHPFHADAFVDKGDPVVFGPIAGNHGVGVAFLSAAAATDRIALDTEGIWNLSVVATNDAGASLVTGGDPLYINTTTCVISKISTEASQIPFGYALGQVAAGATAVIAVKVHWDPPTPEVIAITTLTVSGVTTLNGVTIITGVLYLGAGMNVTGAAVFNSGISVAGGINITGLTVCNGGISVAGTTDLQIVTVHSSLAVAAGGILTFPQTTIATQLPAADPTVAGELWCNAGVVTRSAG